MNWGAKQNLGLIGLLAGTAVAMTAATIVDMPLTKWLSSHGWPVFSEIMGRSLFEGEYPGGGDLAAIFLILVIVLYGASLRPKTPARLKAWRPVLGYMVVSAILTAFAYVHTLKWLLARARPHLVFDGAYAFSNWYQIGPHFITEGIYRGSFISGHTAQMFAPMVLAYALAGNSKAGRGIRAAGWLTGFLVLGAAAAMGIARCMSLAHWVTDVTGAVAMGWLTMHLLYFHILKVPRQEAHWQALDRNDNLRSGWELFMSFYLVAAFGGVLISGIGFRALWMEGGRWLVLLLVPGIPVAVWGFRCSAASCRRLYRALQTVEEESHRT